ncbi:STAS domain-containing protein [Georgenia thermotolerans]|uniref:STAS domain-containing protein n=1 Tax=Georgenia thermotolerans TaxID=527326 RepID=A0A7J5UPY5_9MICO|nr:STAS domain-containing protein [Georgenia thermotolerans]KAE8764476.1 STAS domain-containing protein [Georgenia thermotolerans]
MERRTNEVGWVSVLASGERTRILLAGELDDSLTGDLTEAVDLAVRRGLPVDIDARGLTFMDSSSVATLTRLAARLPERARLIEPPELLLFLLEVTKLDEAMDVLDHDPGFEGVPLSPRRAPDIAPA